MSHTNILNELHEQVFAVKTIPEQSNLLQNFICSWISATIKELTDAVSENVPMYDSQPIIVECTPNVHQFVFNYDNTNEQWAVLLRLNDGFFVVGGYKAYRLFGKYSQPTLPNYNTTEIRHETFINVETGQPVTNEDAFYIAEELLELRVPDSFKLK